MSNDTIPVWTSSRPGDEQPVREGHIRVLVSVDPGALTESEKTRMIGEIADERVLPLIPGGDAARARFNAAMDAILSKMARRHGADVSQADDELSLDEAFAILRTL